MKNSSNSLQLKFNRIIAADPTVVYKAWLDKKVPGTTWYEHEKLILNPKLGGFFYWLTQGTAHYGRFTKLEKAKRIQYTWMSRYTSGEESVVTVTFKKKGADTLMTLVHSGLPKNKMAQAHESGWNYFLDKLTRHFAKKSRSRK